MSAVNKIHHVNFLVRDIDEAEARYRAMLGLGAALREELSSRGVLTARFQIGESWLVLVQPTSEEGEPARHLREHGEGFFLISFGVDDLDAAMERAKQAGGKFSSAASRRGIENWRAIDFDSETTYGAIVQLTEEVGGES